MLLPQSQTAAPAFRGSPAPCNGLLRATSPSTNLRHLLSQASSTKCQALPATGPDASSARATQPSSSRCTWCPQSHEQNAEPRRATPSHAEPHATRGHRRSDAAQAPRNDHMQELMQGRLLRASRAPHVPHTRHLQQTECAIRGTLPTRTKQGSLSYGSTFAQTLAPTVTPTFASTFAP